MRLTLALLLVLAAPAAPAAAAPPVPMLTYSGYLIDPSGRPVTESRTVSFRLYDDAEFGSPLFTEDVAVTPSATGFSACTSAA